MSNTNIVVNLWKQTPRGLQLRVLTSTMFPDQDSFMEAIDFYEEQGYTEGNAYFEKDENV